MNFIIYSYNSTIDEYRNIINNTSAVSIEKKINLISRIESILLIFNLKLKDIRNGKKILKCLIQLNETQFRISLLENSVHKKAIAGYLTSLKKQESDFISELKDFNYRKELKFPAVKKKNILLNDIYRSKSEKFLRKTEKTVTIQSNDIEADVEKIFKTLNKFNKYVLASSHLYSIEPVKLLDINSSLKLLNGIIRYENLISALYGYYKKNIETVEELIDIFEHEKMILVDEFENIKYLLLDTCKILVNALDNIEKYRFKNQLNDTKTYLKKKNEFNLDASPSV